jgi:Rrf2 family cysteine metabolism transcriptional repressor
LKQGGFVESRRGAEGGYLLSRPAETLTAGEVLRFVEGPQSSKGRPRRKAGAPFTDMWQQVDRAVSGVIDKTSFAELVRDWTDRQNRHVHTWEI